MRAVVHLSRTECSLISGSRCASLQRVTRGGIRRADRTSSYFLFIGGSSMNAPQKPVGFTFDAFLITLTFIVLPLSSAGRVMRQRDDRRFKTPLVTCRQIHVAKL